MPDEKEIQSPEVKAVVGFASKSAVAGPTPKGLKLFYRGLMIASMVWAIIVEPIFTNIPMPLAHKIDQVLIALNTVIYQVCQLFGWVNPKDAETTTKV